MKIKLKGNFETQQVWLNGKPLHPSRSQKAYNHSPDGFGWGYGGSVPSQLALAILLEIKGEQEALSTYMDFKWKEISKLPQSDFETEIEI